MVQVMQDTNSCRGGGTDCECRGQTHPKNCTDMEQVHARGQRERHKGTSQLHPRHLYRTNDETHLWSMHTNAGCFNSMLPKTAAMLLLVERAKLEVKLIGLRQRKGRATQQHLPFAGSASTFNVVEQDLALPELFQADWAAGSRYIGTYDIFDAMVLKHVQGQLLV